MTRVPLTEDQVALDCLVLNLENVVLSQEQFFRLCRYNPDLRMELSAQRELIIMTLPGGRTSHRNGIITTRLTNWAEKDGTGLTFDSTCLFALPNGANRAPDAAWVRRKRWDALTDEQQEKIVPFCADFVVELMSPSDRLKVGVEQQRLSNLWQGAGPSGPLHVLRQSRRWAAGRRPCCGRPARQALDPIRIRSSARRPGRAPVQ